VVLQRYAAVHIARANEQLDLVYLMQKSAIGLVLDLNSDEL